MGNIRITGSGMHPQADGAMLAVTSVAKPLQETYSPGGGRIHYPVDVHTVSISEPMDIRAVKLSTAEIALKPGESRRIDVEIERAPEFKGNVTLDVIFQHLERPYGNSLPKGVTLDGGNSKTLLTGHRIERPHHAQSRRRRPAGRETARPRHGQRLGQLRDEDDVLRCASVVTVQPK